MIYADNAATTKLSGTALNAMLPYLREAYGNPSSLYSLGQQAAEALAEARQTVADCLHCRPEEIYFTSGGSEADNQAILSAARRGKARGKTHIISTSFEHHAVLHTLQKLEKEGFTVTLLDVHETGRVTPPAGGRGHHGRHMSCDHHVCQQRDWHHSAHCRHRPAVPGEKRPLPHRRGAGRRPPGD